MSSVPSSRAPVVPGRPLTQGTLVSIDEGVAATLRAFDRADVELRRELERLVRIIAVDPDSTKSYRDSQVRRLLTRVGTLQAELLGQSRLFVEESLARVYAEGILRADAIAAAGGAAALGQPSFTLVHRQALEVLAIDAFDDLAAATSYLDTATKRTIREATKLRTTAGIVSGEGPVRSARRLTRELSRRGVTGFVDAAGRNWRLSSYASMVVRTKAAQGYNTGTILRTEETGTGALEILDGIPSGHDACQRYNGQTCDPAWALANPLEHPNAVAPWARVIPIGRVTGLYRLPWSGPVVRIRTALSGWQTVGPYHPVLTLGRGWQPAHALKHGDQLVRSTPQMLEVSSGRSDLEDVPPRIEEMFHTVSRGRVMAAVPGSPDQFHGDGRFLDGDVDVVWPDGPLVDVAHVPFVEEPHECGLYLGRPTVEAALLARGGTSTLRREGVGLAAPRRMGSGDVRRVVVPPTHVRAALTEAIAHDVVGASEVECDGPGRLSLLVAADEVVHVKVESWSGHLFDLSTESGTYIADGHIVSNCVRSFGPLPLFRGTPQHTAGGTAAEAVARERAKRDLPDDLVVRPPIL